MAATLDPANQTVLADAGQPAIAVGAGPGCSESIVEEKKAAGHVALPSQSDPIEQHQRMLRAGERQCIWVFAEKYMIVNQEL